MKKSYLILFIIIFIISCVKYKSISHESKIDLRVKDYFRRKGYIIYNDSVAVSENYRQVFKKDANIKIPYKMHFIKPPFKLFKKENNDTLLFIKDADTLYYKAPHSNYPDWW